MAMLKSFPAGGRKQAATLGLNSAASKKIVPSKKSDAAARSGSNRSVSKKDACAGDEFSTVQSRQMLVERIKRKIWASVPNINDAIIGKALAGNLGAAKALFDFAGVYSLPEPEDGNAKAAPMALASSPAAGDEALDPVEVFFRSLGVQPPDAKPEPDVAAG